MMGLPIIWGEYKKKCLFGVKRDMGEKEFVFCGSCQKKLADVPAKYWDGGKPTIEELENRDCLVKLQWGRER